MKDTVAVDAGALAAAVKVTFCGVPGRVRVDGFAVTPAGSPVIAIAIVPANELIAVAVMFI